jgi:hypothetical protein
MISWRDFLAQLVEQRRDLVAPVGSGLPVDDASWTIERLGKAEYQVQRRQAGAPLPKQFAYLTFDGIAQHGRARLPLRNYQTKPGIRQAIQAVMQGEMRTAQDAPRRKNLCIILGSQQSMLSAKTIDGDATTAQSGSSNTQTLATLGTTGTNDGTATTRAHAHEETMGTLAAHDGRLIGTFHDRVPCKKSARLQPVRPILVKHFFSAV